MDDWTVSSTCPLPAHCPWVALLLSVGLSCRVASVFHIYLCVCEPICLYSCIGKKRRRRRNGAVLCSFMLATCNFSGYMVRHKYHYTGDASFPHLSFVMAGGCAQGLYLVQLHLVCSLPFCYVWGEGTRIYTCFQLLSCCLSLP